MSYGTFSRRLAAPVGLIVLAACSSGSGSSMSSTSSPGASTFSITAAVPASQGSISTTLNATGSTPTFRGPTAPAVGTVFPLTQTALTFSSSGITADTNTVSQGTNIKLVSLNGPLLGTVELIAPSLGIDQTIPVGVNTTIASGASAGKLLNFDYDFFNYVAYGAWGTLASGTNSIVNASFYISGYQTPVSGLPTSGTATYVGNSLNGSTGGEVEGAVFATSGSSYTQGSLTGASNFSVNFGSGSVTGSLTGMTVQAVDASGNAMGAAQAWNSVNLTGSIAGGKTTFNGTAGTPGASGALGLSSAATGNINGAFYGPNGQELGAVWSLYDGSGASAKSAVGVVTATKQ